MTVSGSGGKASSPLEHVEADIRSLEREWRFERAGWVVLALVIAAGFAGLLGGGLLAGTSAASPNGRVTMEYERIVRHGAPTTIALRLAPSSPGDTTVLVAIDEEYVASNAVGPTLPEPLGVRAEAGRLVYRFRRDPQRVTTIELPLVPGTLGARRATVVTRDGTLPLRQLVLP